MTTPLDRKKIHKNLKRFGEDPRNLIFNSKLSSPEIFGEIFLFKVQLLKKFNQLKFKRKHLSILKHKHFWYRQRKKQPVKKKLKRYHSIRWNFINNALNDQRYWINKLKDNPAFSKYFFKKNTKLFDFTIHIRHQYKFKRLRNERHKRHAVQQKLRLFYTNIKIKQFRNILRKVKKQKKSSSGVTNSIYKFLESRLDMILYRSFFAKNASEARQMIKHGYIKINGKTIRHVNYILQLSDVLEINDKYKNLFYRKLSYNFKYHTFPINEYPAFLEVDYYSLSIIKLREPECTDIFFSFGGFNKEFFREEIYSIFKY